MIVKFLGILPVVLKLLLKNESHKHLQIYQLSLIKLIHTQSFLIILTCLIIICILEVIDVYFICMLEI